MASLNSEIASTRSTFRRSRNQIVKALHLELREVRAGKKIRQIGC